MRHLERAEPPREPGVGEGLRGRDRQHRFILRADRCEGRIYRVESAGQLLGRSAPRLRKPDALLLAAEQDGAQPLFQNADLVADRSLGHPELARGGREILVPRRSLEHPDGGHRWEMAHGQSIR
jgi:hypothetical protein